VILAASDIAIIIDRLGEQARDDIAWAENLVPPTDPDDFALEAIFVICNSGMKNTVARGIYQRVVKQIYAGGPVREVFRHPGKAKAIETIWFDRQDLFDRYMAATDKLEFCGSMPWIGGTTKYHLAKNFGADVAKPDVHLQRLADLEGVTAQQLCERLAAETGYRVATIDTILWRACANGVINSRSGQLAGRAALNQKGRGDE
jgi:hypothetical protein